MSPSILLSKLFKPPQRPIHITRSKLLRCLDEGWRLKQRFFLISAPAGFGKSTLLSAWLDLRKLDYGWLTLDENDDDPVILTRYLITAMQRNHPGFGDNLVQVLNSMQLPHLDVLSTEFINLLHSISTPLIIVLDDFHWIRSHEVLNLISQIIDHLPHHATLMIATRADPPIQLAKYRARAELCEIRAADLRFDECEAAQYLNDKMHLHLGKNATATLLEKTEGWAAGIHMAALSLQGRTDSGDFIEKFGGDDRYIADYLMDEVLVNQPLAIKEFLLRTSFVNRLTANLANHLANRNDSQQILTDLERTNLFILPLDNRREWYRYHHLFAALLQQIAVQTLPTSEIDELHRKTLQWYTDNNFFIEAAQFAIAMKDFHSAIVPIMQSSEGLFAANELGVLRRMGALIPSEITGTNPSLCLLFAWASHASGFHEDAVLYLRLLEQHFAIKIQDILNADDGFTNLPALTRVFMVEAVAIYARMALDEQTPEKVVEYCAKILPFLDEKLDGVPSGLNSPSHLIAPVLFVQGLAYKVMGNTLLATNVLQEAHAFGLEQSNAHVIVLTSSHLGWLKILQGNLSQAHQIFWDSLNMTHSLDVPSSPFESNNHIGLGCIALDRCNYDEASEFIDKGIQFATQWRILEVLLQAAWESIRLHLSQKDIPQARSSLQAIRNLRSDDIPAFTTTLDLLNALIDAYDGRIEQSRRWIEENRVCEQPGYPNLYENGRVILANLLVKIGDYETSKHILDELIEESCMHSRKRTHMEAQVIAASMFEQLHRPDLSEKSLIDALTISKQLGISLPVHLLDRSVEQVLSRIAPHLKQQNLHFVVQHEADQSSSGVVPPLSNSQYEQLTDREVEIVGLMAQGLNNARIASTLVISTNTVKKHISNIFAKLSATTRIEAVEKSRAYGLLPKE